MLQAIFKTKMQLLKEGMIMMRSMDLAREDQNVVLVASDLDRFLPVHCQNICAIFVQRVMAVFAMYIH